MSCLIFFYCHSIRKQPAQNLSHAVLTVTKRRADLFLLAGLPVLRSKNADGVLQINEEGCTDLKSSDAAF